jgi:hypothetical protein
MHVIKQKINNRTNDDMPETLETQNTCGAISVFFTQYLSKKSVVFGRYLVDQEMKAYVLEVEENRPEDHRVA